MTARPWLRQLLVVVAGCAVAAVMVSLGLWQLRVFQEQGRAASAARAAEPPVPLEQAAAPGGPVGDGYGRTVAFRCTYDASLQTEVLPAAVPRTGASADVSAEASGAHRVLSACRLAGGGTLAVVRGIVANGVPTPPPGGVQDQTGVLLPSESADGPGDPGTAGTGAVLASVRIPALAQTWPGPLVDGYVVLSPADAQAQGVTPAPLILPEAQGRLRNGAYALQWWVFAAFAIAMAARIARDLGRDAEPVAQAVVDPSR